MALTANQIAANLWEQVDVDGQRYKVIKEIVDHRANHEAIRAGCTDAFEEAPNGSKQPTETTKGWELQVELNNGELIWVKLKDLKHSNPVELAEYAYDNRLLEEPAFKWWAEKVVRQRNRIVCKMQNKYWRTTHKNGVELPKSAKHALEIDRRNGDHCWRDAICKEMNKACVAYQVVENVSVEEARRGKAPLIGHQDAT